MSPALASVKEASQKSQLVPQNFFPLSFLHDSFVNDDGESFEKERQYLHKINDQTIGWTQKCIADIKIV